MSSYGRACLQCTKAKVRCAYSSDRGPCERCTRLRKECLPAPRARITKGRSRADKHIALEAKVDSLVELLKRNQTIPDDGLSGPNVRVPAERQGYCPDVVKDPLCSLTIQASNDLQSEETSSESHASRTSVASGMASSIKTLPTAAVPELPPETKEELQDILDTYRNNMFPFFPVVYLGPDVTVEHMATKQPFVWLVLRTICSRKLARQLALSAETKRVVTTQLIMEGTRTFDMLAGLTLYVNWGLFFCVKGNLSPPLFLAMGLAGDLGLTKPAPQASPAVMLNWTQQGCPKPPHALVVKPRTMEERRVVLGLFLLSSIASNFFQRSEPMRWGPYLEECLDILMTTKEYATDELLGFLIRVQLICNGIHANIWNECYPAMHATQRLPRAYQAQLHKMQLDELKRSIPAHLQDNAILQFHILGTEVTIYEHNINAPPPTTTVDQTQQVEGLWACFTTVKTYFDKFFNYETFPTLTWLYVSMGIYTHLGHCLVVLFRLSTFESPNVPWNRQHIIAELDLGHFVHKWAQFWEMAPRVAGIDMTGVDESESQWECSKKILLTTILKWWETKVRPSIVDPEQLPGRDADQQPPVGEGELGPDSLPSVDLGYFDWNLDNDQWMRDMLSSGIDFVGF